MPEATIMTTTRDIHCVLIDRPVTLTLVRLPMLLSGIGSSTNRRQTDVDCSDWFNCPHLKSANCARRRLDQVLNGE